MAQTSVVEAGLLYEAHIVSALVEADTVFRTVVSLSASWDKRCVESENSWRITLRYGRDLPYRCDLAAIKL